MNISLNSLRNGLCLVGLSKGCDILVAVCSVNVAKLTEGRADLYVFHGDACY